jgi:AraC-like DNA-binding protein
LIFLESEAAKKGRKDQDTVTPVRNDVTMLRALTMRRDGSTPGRLRRGLSPAEGPQTVDAMARAACFSRRQFHRLTVQLMGETPAAYQRRLRLDRGAWLLLTSRTTILDIALETGWESHETFGRAFRARFQVTPSVFRKDRGRTLPRAMRAGFSIATHISYAKENI